MKGYKDIVAANLESKVFWSAWFERGTRKRMYPSRSGRTALGFL